MRGILMCGTEKAQLGRDKEMRIGSILNARLEHVGADTREITQ